MSKYLLIVDDGPQWIAVVRHALRDAGFELKEACTVEDALDEIGKDMPAVIVLDLAMPAHDEGLRVLRAAKGKDALCKIIVVSSTPDKELLRSCWDLGAYAVIPKSHKDIEADLPREVADAMRDN
jgi:CheY-like chemotaxis protein